MYIQKNFGKLSIRKKYIIRFLIAMMLPMLAAEAGFYQVHLRTVENDIINLKYTCMEQAHDVLDNNLWQLMQIGVKIQGNSGFFTSMLKNNSYRKIQMKNELYIYSIANRFGENMQIYYQEFDGIFSTEGFTDLMVFLKNGCGLNEKEATEFQNILRDPKKDRFYQYRINGKDTLAYMKNLEYNSSVSYSTLFFFIDVDSIRDIFRECIGNDIAGEMALVDADGNILFSDLENSEMIDYCQNTDGNIINKQNQNDQYILMSHVSPINGWRCVFAISRESMHKGISRQQIVLLFIAVMVLLIGIIMSVMLAFNTYRPIGDMYSQVSGEKNSEVNEIDNIITTVSAIKQNNAYLRQSIEKNTLLLVDHAIDRFLNGIYDEETCIEKLATFNVSMNLHYFTIAAISIGGKAEKCKISELHQHIMQCAHEVKAENETDLKALVLERDYENIILWVLNTQNEWDAREYVDALIKKLKNSGIDEWTSIGVGRVYENFADIIKSYTDAMICVEQMCFKQEHGISFYDDIMNVESSDVSDDNAEKLLRLVQSIRQGNEKAAIQILEEMAESIGESYLMARYVLIDIVNTVVHLAYEISGRNFETDLERVLQVRGIKLAIQDLSDLIRKLCTYTAQQHLESSKQLGDNMLRYVQDNYTQPEISLDSVAERFGLSSYYVSRFFGQYAGIPFREYITRMRMEYAKELLLKTDLQIRDIVQKIGYSDASTFIKRFKKYAGVTPGEYRAGKDEREL